MSRCWILLLCLAPSLRADQAADEAILRGARIGTDGPGLVEFFRARVVRSEADAQKIEALVEKLSSGKFKEREKASADLIAIGAPARAALTRAALHKDAEVRRRVADCLAAIGTANSADAELAALRMLRVHRPEGACKVLLAYLPAVRDPDMENELFQTLTVVAFRGEKADEALLAALGDRNPIIRGGAAVLLAFSGSDVQKEQIRQLLKKETDPLVRLRIAQGQLANREKGAVAVLLPLLSDAPLGVAAQAQEVLLSLAEDKAPSAELTDEKAARLKCRDDWERWWDGNQAKLDLAKTEIELPWLGVASRARKVVLRWIKAMETYNADELKKTMDVPFSLVGAITLETREQLEQMFVQALQQLPKERPKVEISSPRLVELKKYLAELPGGGTKDFLQKFPAAEVRIFHVIGKEKDKPKAEGAYLFVRLRKGQAHVIGLAEDPQRKR